MDIHASVARIAMLNGKVDLNTATATAVRCGDANLIERKWLYVMNASASGNNVFIGSSYDNSGTITTIDVDKIGRWGIKMAPGDAIWLPVNDNITVYAICQSGRGRLRIAELG